MSLRNLRRTWNALGAQDPFWAILTHPGTENNRWKVDEFFATGREEAAEVMQYLLAIEPALKTRRALDFGCGVGRLTQPFTAYFDHVTGVDIAASMIERARIFAGENSRCTFVLNTAAHLQIFPSASFDFVYSRLTLQHMEPRHARRYIGEFARVLAPGGVMLFQLTSRYLVDISPLRRSVGRCLRSILRSIPGTQPVMEMYGVPPQIVNQILESAGTEVIAVSPDGSAGPEYESFRYCARKPVDHSRSQTT